MWRAHILCGELHIFMLRAWPLMSPSELLWKYGGLISGETSAVGCRIQSRLHAWRKQTLPIKDAWYSYKSGEGDRQRQTETDTERERERERLLWSKWGECLTKALRSKLIPSPSYEIKVNLESIAEFCYVDIYIRYIHLIYMYVNAAAAAKSLSHVWLLATPWTAVHQAPLSMGFSREEYWSGVPLPSLMYVNKNVQLTIKCNILPKFAKKKNSGQYRGAIYLGLGINL